MSFAWKYVRGVWVSWLHPTFSIELMHLQLVQFHFRCVSFLLIRNKFYLLVGVFNHNWLVHIYIYILCWGSNELIRNTVCWMWKKSQWTNWCKWSHSYHWHLSECKWNCKFHFQTIARLIHMLFFIRYFLHLFFVLFVIVIDVCANSWFIWNIAHDSGWRSSRKMRKIELQLIEIRVEVREAWVRNAHAMFLHFIRNSILCWCFKGLNKKKNKSFIGVRICVLFV